MNDTYAAFLSYARGSDGWLAAYIARRLRRYGVRFYESGKHRVFLDVSALGGEIRLTQKLREAVAGSTTLVVFVSEGAASSAWVNQEIEWWFESDRAAKRRKLVLVHTSGLIVRRNDGNFDWNLTTAVPNAFQGNVPPNAHVLGLTDLRWWERMTRFRGRIQGAVLDVISVVHDVPRDKLVRDSRRVTTQLSGLSLVVLLLFAFVSWQWFSSSDRWRSSETVREASWRGERVTRALEAAANGSPVDAVWQLLELSGRQLDPEARRDLRSRCGHVLYGSGAILGVIDAEDGIETLQYSANGQLLLVVSGNQARVFDAFSLEEVVSVPVPSPDWIELSPYGKLLSFCGDQTVVVWDLHAKRMTWQKSIELDVVGSTFTPDGDHLVYWGRDDREMRLRFRALDNGTEYTTTLRNVDSVVGATRSGVFVSSGNELLFWNVQTGEVLRHQAPDRHRITATFVARHEAGVYYATTEEGSARLFSWEPGDEEARMVLSLTGSIMSIWVNQGGFGFVAVDGSNVYSAAQFELKSGAIVGEAPISLAYSRVTNPFLACYANVSDRHVYILPMAGQDVSHPLAFEPERVIDVIWRDRSTKSGFLVARRQGRRKRSYVSVGSEGGVDSWLTELNQLRTTLGNGVDYGRSLSPGLTHISFRPDEDGLYLLTRIDEPGIVTVLAGKLPADVSFPASARVRPHPVGGQIDRTTWAGDRHLLCQLSSDRKSGRFGLFDIEAGRWRDRDLFAGVRVRTGVADAFRQTCCFVPPDGSHLLVGRFDGDRRKIQVSGKRRFLYTCQPHGRFVALGSGYTIVDSETLEVLEDRTIEVGRASQIAIAQDVPKAVIPCGRFSEDSRLLVVDLENGKETIAPIALRGMPGKVQISADGTRAYVRCVIEQKKMIVHSVYSLRDGRVVFEYQNPGRARMNAAGTRLAMQIINEVDPAGSEWRVQDLELLDDDDFAIVAAVLTGKGYEDGELVSLPGQSIKRRFDDASRRGEAFVGRIRRPLGIASVPATDETGFRVTEASAVGYIGTRFRRGDILLRLDGTALDSRAPLSELLRRFESRARGEQAQLPKMTIRRDGREMEIDLSTESRGDG